MKLSTLITALSGTFALGTTASEPTQIQNANHIFNAIHSSMRQFGSSLHHNGMSFFLASVPEGIQLYHGNARPDLLKEIGWMAFDPEHAMVFARPLRRPKEDRSPNGLEQAEQQPLAMDDESESQTSTAADSDNDTKASGYLHTYRTTKPLRLVYIDGTSAGKARIGTLDLQDRVLFNDTIHGGVSMEDARARSVCRIAENEWAGRIDGVIRMAGGFEIILCKPEVNLSPVRVMPVEGDLRVRDGGNLVKGDRNEKSEGERPKRGKGERKTKEKKHGKSKGKDKKEKDQEKHRAHGSSPSAQETSNPNPHPHSPPEQPSKDKNRGQGRGKIASLLRTITSHFNGIGGDRVVLNYDSFVTAYTYDLDLFPTNSDNKGPRLDHLPTEVLEPIRQDLIALVLAHDVDGRTRTTNWQAIADLIVAKYAPVLRGLLPHEHEHEHGHEKGNDNDHKREKKHPYPNKSKPGKSASSTITQIMTPFASQNTTESILLCATQFLSAPDTDSTLAHQTVYTISHRICSTLLNLRDEPDNEVVYTAVQDLMTYLDWTAWKECRGCKGDEFCSVPIWPNGSERDFARPVCRRFEDGWEGEGYWGGVWR